MRRLLKIFAFSMATAAVVNAAPPPQLPADRGEVDRIVARIEGDIILQSQVQELASFQQLIEGHAQSDDKLLTELIEQWIVQTEATASHFPAPAKTEVDREWGRWAAQFGTPSGYADKLKQVGLSEEEARQLLSNQIYIERYLDYKFRPTVRVESSDIDAYYKTELLPNLAKNKQPAPARAQVDDEIRELLVQRGISDLTAKWLDETKSRLKIELTPAEAKP